jgi:cation:H+ antiporter
MLAVRPEETMSIRAPYAPIVLAAAAALPGVVVFLAHVDMSAPIMALFAGVSILSAAFLLVWACDAAQTDISQSLAIAVVALIAVLPEYAVDMYFTWQAGKFPDSDYAGYAIANMTGANRLIIGVAWAVVVIIFWVKTRRPVVIEAERLLEVRFLAAATLYAMLIPIKGSLTWHDGIVFVGMYIWYIVAAGRRPATEEEIEGPGAYLVALPRVPRRIWTVVLFLFAAAVIVTNAERFCEGLVGTGKAFGINEFLLVQWLAPIASEAPEFVVAIMFALRKRAGLALGSLLSAKLNQWTLLVGMIPWVYAVSSGSLASPLPMGQFQMEEIFLTAAQSVLAVVMVATLHLSIGQALLLFVLFVGQLVAPGLVESLPGGDVMGIRADQMHVLFSLLYLMAAISLVVHQPRRMAYLLRGIPQEERELGTRCLACGEPLIGGPIPPVDGPRPLHTTCSNGTGGVTNDRPQNHPR